MDPNGSWICQMAGSLTCEIIEVMSDVRLIELPPPGASELSMDAVSGLISGEHDVHLKFEAEPRLFARIAKNMIGAEPEDELEVREYASEIFNVICGRIVSELCRASDAALSFSPIEYRAHSEPDGSKQDGALSTLFFRSDNDEFAKLSWSKKPVEDLLKGKV